jgi:putative ABC transport system permease protein
MGASTFGIWIMLSRDFVVLVILSASIAIPLAVSFMSKWLETYHYHATLSWSVFVMTTVGVLIITLGTVSYQAIAAATANPIKSLRSE